MILAGRGGAVIFSGAKTSQWQEQLSPNVPLTQCSDLAPFTLMPC